MLNIKDAETDRLAREVAAMTGETITAAVRTALLERKQRLAAIRPQPIDREALEAILQRVAAVKPADLTSDHSDLYDEFGLPK